MSKYTVAANNVITAPFASRVFKGEVIPYSVDFSPWADDNADTTSATWTVEKGDASVSGMAFSANLASANITFPSEGTSLIEVAATNGTLKKVVYLSIYASDPNVEATDYEQ